MFSFSATIMLKDVVVIAAKKTSMTASMDVVTVLIATTLLKML